MKQRLIALLGKKDEPTDAVEEYCRNVGAALEAHDFETQLERVAWPQQGWPAALDLLRKRSAEWRGSWVILQYTALAWSARGFPLNALRVVKILKSAGVRTGIVYHDVEPYSGLRTIDRVRRRIQFHVLRKSLAEVDAAIFTVNPEYLSWCGSVPANGAFIPVGPNLPVPVEFTPAFDTPTPNTVPTVGVFSVTGGDAGSRETETIIDAVRYASEKLGKMRLLVFGRHAELRETALRSGLRDCPVEVQVEGVLSPEEVVQRLRASDVLVFVRGGISSRRTSAISGIVAGVPVIAYSDSETGSPITDAGVLLVSQQRPQDLRDGLVRLLSDADLRAEMGQRSRRVYREHFCWEAVARRYAEVLRRPSGAKA